MPDPTHIIAGALDDTEQVGHLERWDQADAILTALNRYGYTITEKRGKHMSGKHIRWDSDEVVERMDSDFARAMKRPR